jgi:hypothetical protein
MGSLGIGIMNLMDFLLSSKDNSKIDGKQITVGAVHFQPHPPTLALVFANLDLEMDLTIGSFNFCFGSLESVRLSNSINLGPSAGQTVNMATSETLVGSSSEVNSPFIIKPMKSKRNTMKELDEITENLDLEESSGYSDMTSNKNLDNISNYPEEEFTVGYGDVSNKPEDTWRT